MKKTRLNARMLISALLMAVLLISASSCNRKDTEPEPVPDTADAQEKGSKVIVVYFSYTGNTKTLAQYIAEETDADTYEIIAKDPYTEDDTRYDEDTRAYKEQSDPDCRPEIDGQLPDLSGYEIVFVGYPIWHGQAPKIVYTFLENVELAGKTVIPFCTSAESPVGNSAKNLEPLAPEANWQEGVRLEIDMTQDDISKWIISLYASK
ncbi:MAG: flavodoxin [Erysipelotrichaceae bacterium]|nr:flavodoxin [Erysipelotrichaceae bacterium]